MATTTYTATTFNAAPKQVHVGNVTVSGTYNAGATVTSLGDIIFLAKIPHGATIVDMVADTSTGETACGTDFGFSRGFDVGGGASLSLLVSAVAQATVTRLAVRRAAGLGPIRCSVSDLDPVRYGIFSCKPSTGSASTSFMVNFSITYRCDGA